MSKVTMFQPAYRAEGLSSGCDCSAAPINPWPLDPAHEVPGRLAPMSVLPPPRRSLPRRVVGAICSLGSAVAAGAAMLLLAQHLTMP